MAFVVSVLVAGVFLVLNGEFVLPMLYGDEGGYLGNARRVADSVGASLHGYLAGYSLFLIPPALATNDPWIFYRLALDVNAVLAGATAGMLVLLSRMLFPRISRPMAGVAALLAMTIGGVSVFPYYAMSENVLVPAIVAASLLLVLALRSEAAMPRRKLLAGFSFVCAFPAWANPRGLAIAVGGIAIAAVLLVLIDAWQPSDLLVVLGVMGAGLVLGELVNRAIVGTVTGTPGTDPAPYLDVIRDVGLWGSVALNFVRRLGYLTVASVGMIWVVVVWLARTFSHRSVSTEERDIVVTSLFVGVGVALSVVLNSMTIGLVEDARADLLFYGRYFEIFLPVLVVIAVGLAVSRLSRSEMRIVALLSLVSAVIAAAALSVESLDRAYTPINAISIYAIAVFMELDVVLAFVVGGVVAGSVWLAMSVRLRMGLAYAGAALVVIAISAYGSVLLPPRQWRSTQVVISEALLDMQKANQLECLGVLPFPDEWHQTHQYLYFVPGLDLEQSANPLCGLRVGSAPQYAARSGAIRLAYEPVLDLYLWREANTAD